MDFQLTVGGGVPLTPVVYCSRANRTFHSRTQAPGRKGMLFPRQRPGDRIWLLLFFLFCLFDFCCQRCCLPADSPALSLALMGPKWKGPMCRVCTLQTLSLKHSEVSRKSECLLLPHLRTKNCGLGQDAMELRFTIVLYYGVSLLWKQNRAKVHFLGAHQYLPCFPHFFLPPPI